MIEIVGGKWEGLEGMTEEIFAALRPRAEVTFMAAVLLAEGELRKTLSRQPTGRMYQITKTGPAHIASAPGEPPAVLHDRLRGSVNHTDPKWEGDTLSAEWGVGPVEYARRLEFGGMSIVPHDVTVQVAPGVWRVVKAGTVIKIAARPYLAPTEERIRPQIDALFEAGI